MYARICGNAGCVFLYEVVKMGRSIKSFYKYFLNVFSICIRIAFFHYYYNYFVIFSEHVRNKN